MSPETTPRIYKLPQTLSNQIAAGEVIERPASVVKELLENSLDAGAGSIEIQIERGGARLIRVQDDGIGIHSEDLRLALESHATSKLRTTEDLLAIRTLGFRGEALSSIASVARVSILSKTANSNTAWSIIYDPMTGAIKTGPVAHPPGTTVTVGNLFIGMPARRVFLRSERTEFLHILETVKRLALSDRATTIRLQHDGKPVFHCRGQENPALRVRELLGKNFIEHAIWLDQQNDTYRLWGWVGDESLHRSQVERQYLYFNKRIIRDRKLNHAIRTAYGEKIPVGRYPEYLLYLEMDPSLADVNVHPAKHEVRFHEMHEVHDFVHGCVRHVLTKSSAGAVGLDNLITPANRGYEYAATGGTAYIREAGWNYRQLAPSHAAETGKDPLTDEANLLHALTDRYIIVRCREGVLLMDIAGVRRFIAAAKLDHLAPDEEIPSRPLLVPISLNVQQELPEPEDEFQELCCRFGLGLNYSGTHTLVLRTIPLILEDADLKGVLEDILYSVKSHDSTGSENLLLEVKAILAKRAAMTGAGLDRSSLNALLKQLRHAGTDFTAAAEAGVWRKLDHQTLSGIIGDAA